MGPLHSEGMNSVWLFLLGVSCGPLHIEGMSSVRSFRSDFQIFFDNAKGNAACWDEEFTFARCCYTGTSECWIGGFDHKFCCVSGPMTWRDVSEVALHAARTFTPSLDEHLPDYVCREQWSVVRKSLNAFWAARENLDPGSSDFVTFGLDIDQMRSLLWNSQHELSQCPLGVMAVVGFLMNILLSDQDLPTASVLVQVLEVLLQKFPLKHVIASPWPVFAAMRCMERGDSSPHVGGTFASVARLDSNGATTLRFNLAGSELRALHSGNFQNLNRIYAEIREATLEVHQEASGGLILCSYVYGNMGNLLRAWVGRLSKIGFQMLLFTGDDSIHHICLDVGSPLLCLRSHMGIMITYVGTHSLLAFGFDVLFIDFDAILRGDPTQELARIASAKQVDMLLMVSDPQCEPRTPVIYAKATKAVQDFMFMFVAWLFQHPDEFEQFAFASFLLYGEGMPVVNAPAALRGVLQRLTWDRLEHPPRRFVEQNAQWTGNTEDILIWHKSGDDGKLRRMQIALGENQTAFAALVANQWRAPDFFSAAQPCRRINMKR